MRKSWGVAIGAAAVASTALMPGVALAQPTPPTPNGSTSATFTVTASGTLQISAPTGTVNLSSTATAAPGGTITGSLGTVTVTDLRSLAAAGWTASVASSNFTTGGATAAETIPAADLAYDPTATLATLFGTYTSLVGTPVAAMPASPATTVVVTAAGANGDNQASWNPVITVTVPASAVAGTYSGTITHSVLPAGS